MFSSIFAILLLFCLCTAPIIIICAKRLKSKQKKMKNQAEPDEQNVNVIYDEIDERPQVPKSIYTSENIAYSQLHHSNIIIVPHPAANNN